MYACKKRKKSAVKKEKFCFFSPRKLNKTNMCEDYKQEFFTRPYECTGYYHIATTYGSYSN